MDRDELRLREAATRQGLSAWKNDNGTWSFGAAPSVEPLRPGHPVEPSETLLSGDRVRVGDRTFKREMTEAEAREALGLDA
jgi:hypothetical protein